MPKLPNLCVLLLCLVVNTGGQELNVIPNILSPFLRNVDEYVSINLMANISEKIFNFKKMGFKFGAHN